MFHLNCVFVCLVNQIPCDPENSSSEYVQKFHVIKHVEREPSAATQPSPPPSAVHPVAPPASTLPVTVPGHLPSTTEPSFCQLLHSQSTAVLHVEMSPSGCRGLPVALLALLFCPGSAEELKVRMHPEKMAVEHGGSQVINCSTTCPRPNIGGLETSLNKTLLQNDTQWKQYEVSGISQDTVVYCYFTCSEKQLSVSGNISVFHPPKEVLMTVHPVWVIVGKSFLIECRVPAVAPLEKLTLTLLRGNESLHRQTFEEATAAPQEAMTTYNRTAHREDERYNFSCQAHLNLESRGGKNISITSEPQGLKIHEPTQPKQMVIIIAVVSVLLSLFVTSVLLCFVFGQQWHQRRRGSYRVQAAWRRLRRAYRA